MSMISGKLGRINRISRKNQRQLSARASAWCHWHCRWWRARGNQFYHCMGNTLSQPDAPDWLLCRHCPVRTLLLGRISYGAMAGSLAGTNGHQRDYPYHGSVVNGVRHRIYRYRYKKYIPRISTLTFVWKSGASGSVFTWISANHINKVEIRTSHNKFY